MFSLKQCTLALGACAAMVTPAWADCGLTCPESPAVAIDGYCVQAFTCSADGWTTCSIWKGDQEIVSRLSNSSEVGLAQARGGKPPLKLSRADIAEMERITGRKIAPQTPPAHLPPRVTRLFRRCLME